MKPNVLFIVIDGFRNDKFHGKNKSSLTPNLDKLISKGTYFNQTISSSDGTRTCMGSILTAQYPFQSGLTTFQNHDKATKFFNFFQNQGYSLFATLPDVDFWKTLTENFTEKDLYPKPYEYLFGGTGEKILKRLKYANNQQPWIYYIHIMDLHRSVNFTIPENFKNEKFGTNDYEKMISAIDLWIGKILKEIDLTRTLVVITSDHGEFIPISSINHEITYIPSLVHFGQKIKSILPEYFHPYGLTAFVKIRDFLVPIRKLILKTKLSPEEMRTLNIRGTKMNWELFDEVVKTPLLFSGYGINTSRIINQQIRQIDIFPTILAITGFTISEEKLPGRSLLPAINGEDMSEEPALIENQLLDPNDNDIVIGIRTSNYKYFRSIVSKNNKNYLYDLKNDPGEKNNIADKNPDIVQQMENLLIEHRQNEANPSDEYDADEVSKIKDELKKMGYI